jgi:hypothetical protein
VRLSVRGASIAAVRRRTNKPHYPNSFVASVGASETLVVYLLLLLVFVNHCAPTRQAQLSDGGQALGKGPWRSCAAGPSYMPSSADRGACASTMPFWKPSAHALPKGGTVFRDAQPAQPAQPSTKCTSRERRQTRQNRMMIL